MQGTPLILLFLISMYFSFKYVWRRSKKTCHPSWVRVWRFWCTTKDSRYNFFVEYSKINTNVLKWLFLLQCETFLSFFIQPHMCDHTFGHDFSLSDFKLFVDIDTYSSAYYLLSWLRDMFWSYHWVANEGVEMLYGLTQHYSSF